MDLARIQQELHDQGLDGWLFFDHHMRDPLAYRVLGLPPRTPTRRWYYLIPAAGEPRGLEHRIERGMTAGTPGEKLLYSGWSEQVECLRRMTAGLKRIAMQYSPLCAIPYVSMVDAGTVELVRSLGVEVVSAAELIQVFEARWTPAQLESHLEAGRRVDRVRAEAFALIAERARNRAPLSEVEVKMFIRERFAKAGLVTDHGPIVGVNANSSDQHYEPTEEVTAPIRSGDWVLLDMWAKLDRPDAVYYDITWTGFCGGQPIGGNAQGLRGGDRRTRCRHTARPGSGGGEAGVARLRSGRCQPRRDCERRLWRVFRASHRPFDRRGSARQRRQHGQPGEPRRAARHSLDVLFD